MQLQSKLLKCYIGIGAKTSKIKTPETNCKVLPNLKYYNKLIKPKLLFYTKVTPKISLQSYPPSAANTTLGICYTCEALCCSAHGCCSVECGVACCTAQHTAISTLTFTSLPDPIQVEGEDHFKVGTLLKHRSRGNSWRYLLRWLGYGPEHDEWIHEVSWLMELKRY